jgi:predicted dehydrogenase
MTTDRIRIGFIGAGGIVRQRHVPGLKAVPGVELAGVVNSTPESSERAVRELGIARAYESPEALIGSDDVDAVWIGTQPYLHSKLSIAALEAGKHVFCQARMAMDYADARRMYDVWKRSGLTANICAAPHYMRGDPTVRRLLNEGFVGQPYDVVVRSYADQYHDPNKPLHWRQIASISGVNTMDVGMMIEVVHRWLGYTRRVVAQTRTVIAERPPAEVNQGHGQTRVERPDTLTVAAQMEDGALFSGLWSGVARFGEGPNAIEIYGSDGSIRYLSGTDAPGSGRVLAARTGDTELRDVPIPDAEAGRWTVERDFIAAVREGRPDPAPSFWDGLKYMEFTDAVFKSAAEGRAVDLPYEPELRPA